MADSEGKKLTELRVIDLKTELERRGLDKTGNKAALLERLSKAISAEGHNPEEFLIVPCVGASKTTPRKNSVTGVLSQDEAIEGSENQKEDNTDGQDSAEVKVKEEPPIVEDDTIPSRKKETQDEGIKKVVVKEEKQEVKEEVKDEPDENMGKKDTQKTNDVKPTECSAISPTTVTATATTVTAVEANGIDNEDSINLTIGEDEENLLVEESEVHDRQKVAQETPDQKCKPQEESVRVGERTGSSESDHIATLIVPADGGEKRKEENKKGDSKGSGRAEGAGNKEGAAGANGIKSKLDGGDGGKSGDSNSKGQKRDEKDKKISPVSPANASSRNLWVSGLSSTTRATDLKQIFSKYGKVIGAKVVTNARTPGARCYGYVTMSTSEDAAKCIQHLHRTELHGRVISVEKAKGDSQQSHMRKRESVSGKSEKREDKEKFKDSAELNDKKEKEVKKEVDEKEKEEKAIVKKSEETVEISDGKEKKTESTEKKEEPTKESDTRSTKSTSKKPEGDRGRRDEKRVRPWDHHRSHTRSRSRERRRRDDVLTFAKIREERERQRLRERERILREEERRRQEDMKRQREIERRQREEAARLEREREKLRRERERIAQEKAELLRLERERQKLERENLEREQEELQRQQKRLEESRRPPPPPSIKRTSSDRRDLRDVYAEPERKRIASEHSRRHSPDRVSDRRPEILDRVSDRRLDQSPPSRYESSRSTQELGLKRDFKRGSDFPSRSTRPESFPEVSRGREVIVRREPLPAQTSSIDPRQVKDRYERPATTTYTRDRDIRRSEPESHRSSRDGHARYSESAKPPGSSASRDSRYGDSSRAPGGWHSGPPSSKSFNSVPSGGPRDPRSEPSGWSSRSSDNVNRWGSSGSMGSTMRHPGPPIYQGGPMPSMGLAPPGTGPSYDRFDPYKSSMPSMRKY